MGTYNILRESSKRHEVLDGFVGSFIIGSTAGVVTVYATQPLDTIKTQSQGVRGSNTLEAVKHVFASSGIRGFWRGSTMRLGRLILSGGIIFSTYEAVLGTLSGIGA